MAAKAPNISSRPIARKSGPEHDQVTALTLLCVHRIPSDIGRFMVFFGPINSVVDITTFAVMRCWFSANPVAASNRAGSSPVCWPRRLIVRMIRTPKPPFIESCAAAPLVAMMAAIMVVGIWPPIGSLAKYVKLKTLPPAYFVWLVGILDGYSVLTTVMKGFYSQRFGWQ